MTPAREELGVRYRELAARVGAFAAQRVPADSVDDIVSETFTRAFGHIDTYAQRGSDIGAWLIAIASNIIIDQYRRRVRRPEVLGDVPERPDQIIELEAGIDLRRIVAGLPTSDAEFIALRFGDDLLLRDVARRFGHHTPWASRREARILADLRELVDA